MKFIRTWWERLVARLHEISEEEDRLMEEMRDNDPEAYNRLCQRKNMNNSDMY